MSHLDTASPSAPRAIPWSHIFSATSIIITLLGAAGVGLYKLGEHRREVDHLNHQVQEIEGKQDTIIETQTKLGTSYENFTTEQRTFNEKLWEEIHPR